MKRPPAPLQLSSATNDFAQIRQSHPLLGGFPLAVMVVGILFVLFALTMTLNADADGAAHASRNIPHVQRSVAAQPVAQRIS